ncbi:MAG: hypothetical protein WC913_01550 [Desulfuromonas sp.]
MKKNIWEQREKAFEDKYFHDLEREQLRKLREQNAPHPTEETEDSATSDSLPEVENRKEG